MRTTLSFVSIVSNIVVVLQHFHVEILWVLIFGAVTLYTWKVLLYEVEYWLVYVNMK